MGRTYIEKYLDLGSPIVKNCINNIVIPNTLIDLGETINVMTKNMLDKLQLKNLQYTPSISQLADRSIIKSKGVLEDILMSLDSWEYLVNFMVLTPKTNLGGHLLILRRSWLATFDEFISCRCGDMTISYGNATKKFTLYPPAKTITELENI